MAVIICDSLPAARVSAKMASLFPSIVFCAVVGVVVTLQNDTIEGMELDNYNQPNFASFETYIG